MADSQIPFHRWLRGRRAEKGQWQAVCAESLGVSVATLSRWERGFERPIKLCDLEAIARWAGVEPTDILPMLTADAEPSGDENAA